MRRARNEARRRLSRKALTLQRLTTEIPIRLPRQSSRNRNGLTSQPLHRCYGRRDGPPVSRRRIRSPRVSEMAAVPRRGNEVREGGHRARGVCQV